MPDENQDANEGIPGTNDGTEVDVERLVTREDGAAALRRLADSVANGSVELGADDAITATIPERFELTIEYEQADDEAELEAELEWSIVEGEPEADDGERGGDGENGEFGDEGDAAVTADADEPVAEVVGVGDAASNARFELYRDRADEWRWRLVHDNGNIIADSGEGYDRKGTARKGLESVMRNAPGATIVDLED